MWVGVWVGVRERGMEVEWNSTRDKECEIGSQRETEKKREFV